VLAVSITPADLMKVARRVGVAGGASKYRAIRAALLGGWVNLIVTDLDIARGLAEDCADVRSPGILVVGRPSAG
jgi:DNA-binding transcriptional regulator LsrR (DeoR family)